MKNTDDESKLQDKSNNLQEQSEKYSDSETPLQSTENNNEIATSKENQEDLESEDEEKSIQSEVESSEEKTSSTQFRVLPNDTAENEHHNVKLQKYFQTGNEFVELNKETTLKLGILTVLYNSLQKKETPSSNSQINTILQNILMNLAMSFVKKSNNVSLFVLSNIDDNQYLDQLQQELTDEIIKMIKIIRQDDSINNLSTQYQKIIYNLLDTTQEEIITFIHNEHLLQELNEEKITLNSEMFKTTKNFIDTFQAIMKSNNDDYEDYDDDDDYSNDEDEDYIEDYIDYDVGYNIFDEDLNIATISKQTLNRIVSLNSVYAQCLNIYPKKLQNNTDYFDNSKDSFNFNSKISHNQTVQASKDFIHNKSNSYNNIIIIMEQWNFIRFQEICKKLHFSCKVRCFPILTIDENKQTKLSFAELNGLCLKYYRFFRKYDHALKKFSKKLIQYKLWCQNFIYTQYKILLDVIDNVKR